MTMKKVIYATGVLAVVILAACSKSNENLTMNSQDQTFELKGTVSNTAEINAGNLVLTKGTNARVKSFAQFMIAEHTTAQTDLKSLGTSTGMAIRDSIDPAHQAIMAQLMSLPAGRAFDSAYIYSQVADHDMTIANFQAEINGGNHRDVKAYASTYLPHIQMHRMMADSISTAYFRR